MKKHLSLLLCLLMLVSMFSVFTVQSSAAATPMIWDFTDSNSVAKAINGTGGAGCNDLYIGAFRHTGGSPYSGTVAYDANEKAVVLGTAGDGVEYSSYRTYMISKKTSFNPADYPYLKLRFKVESNLTNLTMKLRNTSQSNWPGIDLYTNNLPTGEWVEVIFNVGGDNAWAKSGTVKATTSAPDNALNVSWSLQILPASGNFKDGDFTLKLQYAGFFATEAEAKSYPSTPIIMEYDQPTNVLAAIKNNTYTAEKYALGYVNTDAAKTGTSGFDADEGAVWMSAPSDGTKVEYVRGYFQNFDKAFNITDYPYVKVRMKIDTELTGKFWMDMYTSAWKQVKLIQNYVADGEWFEAVIPLAGTAWYTNGGSIPVTTDSNWTNRSFYWTVYSDDGTVLTKDNFKAYVQYIAFFATEAEAKAYTYEKKEADSIVWNFDSHNALPAYATDLNDGYVSYVNHDGTAAKVDFDSTEQSMYITPDYTKAAATTGNFMHIRFNNTGSVIKGEDYPFVKIRFKLDTDSTDPFNVYFRTAAYSINNISYPAKTNEWIEVVVDMAAAHNNKNLGWARSVVQSSSDIAKWGLLLQVENKAAAADANIFDDEDFRVYIQYVGFFATKAEADAYTYTAPATPSAPKVEMKLDTPNASSSITTDTANLVPFYASNILMGNNSGSNWPIGIMGYDAEERSLYFVNDAADNGKFPMPYLSRVYISSKSATVKGEDYRYMKIRYKLVTDDPNVAVYLRDSATWGKFYLHADKKTPINEWVEIVVDMWKTGAGWMDKTIISPSNALYLQFDNNDTTVNNYAKDDYRIYLQYISFFATEEEANAYTYVSTDMNNLPNADDYVATGTQIVMPFHLPKYSYALGGNRYTSTYAIVDQAFGADKNGAIKFDEKEQSIYIEGIESLETVTHARFVIRGGHEFSGADYPYVKLCYKITNYEFGANDYLTFRNGSSWSTIQLSADKLKADEWVTITANLNAMPGGSTWKSTVIGGTYGASTNDLRLQLYLNKTTGDNFTTNPDTRFYLKYIAFFKTQADAEAFDFAEWSKPAAEDTDITADLWLKVLARKYAEKYTLTASCTEGGAISSIGDTQVKYKKDMTYTITAAEGYTLTDVLVDGKSVGAVTEYTFDNVKKAHTIHAVFTAKEGK